jgi:GMP synthase-like glutamine amidotransferase
MAKKALVFQHMDDEPPGLFGEFLSARDYSSDIVLLHRGEAIPTLQRYDFLLVMGGAMDVWEEGEHPWLVAEKQAIVEWAFKHARPYFGVCLGMQLLAEALGGTVGLGAKAEVGIGRVSLTETHWLTEGLPRHFHMMQWHHAEVKRLPSSARALASSRDCGIQIMAAGDNLVGTQFHGELTPELVARWAHIPQYIQWLDEALGTNAYERVREDALPLMPSMRRTSLQMFNNLLKGKALREAA